MEIQHEEILAAKSRLLTSGAFGQSARQPAIFAYVIDEYLAGRSERIKAYTIAVDILGKSENFDASQDSSVRVEFHRIRQALASYYAGAGISDPLEISFPVGSYAPVFQRRQAVAVSPALPQRRPFPFGWWLSIAALIAVVVVTGFFLNSQTSPKPEVRNAEDFSVFSPILSIVQRPETVPDSLGFLRTGIRQQLAAELTQISSITIYDKPIDSVMAGSEGTVGFELNLDIQSDHSTLKLFAVLSNPNGEQVWGKVYTRPILRAFDQQDDFVKLLLSELRAVINMASVKQLAKQRKESSEKSIWELYLEASLASSTGVSTMSWEEERLGIAQRVIQSRPSFGPAHALAAQKYGLLFGGDPGFATPDNLLAAEEHAKIALSTAWADPDALFSVALYRWMIGDLASAESLMGRILELDRGHFLANALVGQLMYTCAAAPKAMVEHIKEIDANASPANRMRWMLQIWLSGLAINAHDLEGAEAAARRSYEIYSSPDNFIRLAAVMARRGDKEGAVQLIKIRKLDWPNLNLHHYADTVVRKRCGNGSEKDFVLQLYKDLAILIDS